MTRRRHSACIEACHFCALACQHCAAACLQEPDPEPLARCISLSLDCSDLCDLTVRAIARASEHSDAICALCADLCDSCGSECSQHDMEQCCICANACRRCAEECRRMLEGASAVVT